MHAMLFCPTGLEHTHICGLYCGCLELVTVKHPFFLCPQGANAPLSGLVAMLGALHALKAALDASSSYTRRIVFLALAGEPWAYMGSRRLLYEASVGSNATAGLDLSLMEKVGCMQWLLA